MAAFDVLLHELGYTYHGDAPITGLTRFEIDKLQLGWIVKQEQQEDAVQSSGATTHAQQQKMAHKQDIRQRLRRQ